MKMKDQQKVMDAGFRIFRKDEIRLRITEAKGAGAWAPHSMHKSKAAMNRAWDELMKDPKNIEG